MVPPEAPPPTKEICSGKKDFLRKLFRKCSKPFHRLILGFQYWVFNNICRWAIILTLEIIKEFIIDLMLETVDVL